jgi:hypothetical protein
LQPGENSNRAAQLLIALHISAVADSDGQSTARRYRQPLCATSPFNFPEVITLDQDPLNARNTGAGSLIQTDGIVGAVIKLRRARRLVIRHLLRVLNCTTILQVRGDGGSRFDLNSNRLILIPGSARCGPY